MAARKLEKTATDRSGARHLQTKTDSKTTNQYHAIYDHKKLKQEDNKRGPRGCKHYVDTHRTQTQRAKQKHGEEADTGSDTGVDELPTTQDIKQQTTDRTVIG